VVSETYPGTRSHCILHVIVWQSYGPSLLIEDRRPRSETTSRSLGRARTAFRVTRSARTDPPDVFCQKGRPKPTPSIRRYWNHIRGGRGDWIVLDSMA
jgi:hypothetical protein